MMVASPTAAPMLSEGAVFQAMGRTMPIAPAISAMPMKVAILLSLWRNLAILLSHYASNFVSHGC
jgi:hypothetical protein